MNEKTTRSLWIVTTALTSVAIITVFGSGGGTSVDLSAPIMRIVAALLGLSIGIASIIYAGVFVKIRRARSRGVPYRQTSWWHLLFWALFFLTCVITIPVDRGSISLDLPTGFVFVLFVLLSSGGLWIQHGFVVRGRGGYPGKDERTDRVQGRAALYTLFVVLGVIIELLVYNVVIAESVGFPEMSGGAVLILLLAAIVVSYAVLHWHFNKRRDV